MKLTSLSIFVLVASLTGCAATGPKFVTQEAATPRLAAEKGRVYFYRPGSMLGAALKPEVQFDGKVVGTSQQGGYFYTDAAAGSHVAETSTEASNRLSFVLDKGETKYVRTKVSMGVLAGHVVPELVGAEEARKELGELSYTGTPKSN